VSRAMPLPSSRSLSGHDPEMPPTPLDVTTTTLYVVARNI
jgi:hypothetical protein